MKSKKIFILIWISILLTFISGCNPDGKERIDPPVKISSQKDKITENSPDTNQPYPFKSSHDLKILNISHEDIVHILENNGIKESQYFKVEDGGDFGTWKNQAIWLSKNETLGMKSKRLDNLSSGIFFIELNDFGGSSKERNRQIAIDLITALDPKIDGVRIYDELVHDVLENSPKDVSRPAKYKTINGITINIISFNVQSEYINFSVFQMN